MTDGQHAAHGAAHDTGHGARVAALERNLDRLSREVSELAETLGAESRLAGEEAVGAELLAGRELVAGLGIVWETAQQLGDVQVRQLELWLDDQLATLTHLPQQTLEGRGADVLRQHLRRRASHLSQGARQTLTILSRQSSRALAVMGSLWQPYLNVLRQDRASSRQPRPDRS